MNYGVVNHEVVIVGAGIAGLATALALHRKGIQSVVLEKSETLRTAEGAGIGIRSNGWRALDQLGVADSLRKSAFPIQRERDVWLDKEKQHVQPLSGEYRCLKRSDLINTLYSALPPGTIQFGHQIVCVAVNPQTSHPMLQLINGKSMVMKVLIGCDGVNSVVADYLGVKPTKAFGLCEVRGLTNYPNGHSFGCEFARIRKHETLVGRIPIDDNLVYWFVTVQRASAELILLLKPSLFDQDAIAEAKIIREPEQIRQLSLETVNGFPHEVEEMIKCSDLESLSFSRLRYRTPWDLLMGRFRKGTVTIAGDAMHAMGPFLGQGGSAGLEDAVVLAKRFAHKLSSDNHFEIGEAINQYIKARRMRVVRLSTQNYLIGQLSESCSPLMKYVCVLLMMILFYDGNGHTKYDCGTL